MLQQKTAQYITNEKLFSIGDKILVALSGGADSVALLRILLSLGYECEAAHCNFHLRGEESDRDESFVKLLCNELQIPLHNTHFKTEEYAAQKKVSIEMAARELRYQWFEEIRIATQSVVIAVAHHKDDSVETLLLNLIRGTGINGLLGIRPKNRCIVRPLLCANRIEIIDYLKLINQGYVTDSTNLQDEYTRNKIRLNLLPLMTEINPSVKDSIIATSNHLNNVIRIYNKGIEEGKRRILENNNIRIKALQSEPAPESLLFEILYPLGFNSDQIRKIFLSLNRQSGKKFISKNNWVIIKDRELLFIEKNNEETDPTPPFRLTRKDREYTPDFIIPREKEIACFDTEKLKGEIHLRKLSTGDIFIPFGMNGKKLVSDYLINRKFSLTQKQQQWVLCCDKDIIWIVGERTDNRFRIDEKTKNISIFQLIPER